MKYIDVKAPIVYPIELDNAKLNLPFQLFSSATYPANGNAINGPTNAQKAVEYKALSDTELIYIVLPISSTRAEMNIIEYFFIFSFLIYV